MASSSTYKLVSGNKSSPTSAIESFYSVVEELAAEAREIVDNAPESLANTSRIETFGETADTLEGLTQPEWEWGDTAEKRASFPAECTYSQCVLKRKRGNISRSVRMENACMEGRAGVEAISEYVDDETQWTSEDQDLHDELRDFCDTVTEHLDEAESVEFPGMYG